jgi:hypothetical protein
VKLNLKVEPGNTITASVNAIDRGTTIEVQLINRSRHMRVTKFLPFAAPDLSSAEWITEAPAACSQTSCRIQPLADFGSVSFTKIAALGNGYGGTLTDPAWSTAGIELEPDGSYHSYFPGPDSFGSSPDSTAGATPGALTLTGNSFSVAWEANALSG